VGDDSVELKGDSGFSDRNGLVGEHDGMENKTGGRVEKLSVCW